MNKVSRLQKTDWNCRVPNGRPRAEENAQNSPDLITKDYLQSNGK